MLLHYVAFLTMSRQNNQGLNAKKSAELIVSRRHAKRAHSIPPHLPGIARVESLTLLGVDLDTHLTPPPLISKAVLQAAQSTYTVKGLKSYGLPLACLILVCNSKLVS